jgi:hypothetical protein
VGIARAPGPTVPRCARSPRPQLALASPPCAPARAIHPCMHPSAGSPAAGARGDGTQGRACIHATDRCRAVRDSCACAGYTEQSAIDGRPPAHRSIRVSCGTSLCLSHQCAWTRCVATRAGQLIYRAVTPHV